MTNSAPPSSAGEELVREQRRKQQILPAVIAVVAEDGFEGATMRKIAERAGVSVGMLSYYYRNKREMIQDALRDAHNRAARRRRSRCRRRPGPGANPRPVPEHARPLYVRQLPAGVLADLLVRSGTRLSAARLQPRWAPEDPRELPSGDRDRHRGWRAADPTWTRAWPPTSS